MQKIIWIIIAAVFIASLWFFSSAPMSNKTAPPVVDLSTPAAVDVGDGNNPAFAPILALSDLLVIRAKQQATTNGSRGKAMISDETSIAFEKFARLAKEAASYIDDNDGPADLACIFRGMAADADRQLDDLRAASSAAEQSRIWSEAADLFADVRLVLFPVAIPPQIDGYNGETCAA